MNEMFGLKIWSIKIVEKASDNFPELKAKCLVLFDMLLIVYYKIRKKISKSSYVKSWNQRLFGIFA